MKFLYRHGARLTVVTLALISLTACGGGGSGGPPPTPTYSISVTVTGVDPSKSIVLKDNGGDDVTVNANGIFTFNTEIASGGNYAVTVSTPSGVTCSVGAGSGIASSDINNVTVTCADREFAYVTGAADGTISGFSIDATTGALAAVGPPVAGGSSPYAMTGTSERKFLYVGNSAAKSVSGYSVDAASGKLTALSGSPFAAGTTPRSLLFYSTVTRSPYDIVDGPGEPEVHWYLYVANAGSNSVSVYTVDRGTGVPTPVSPASYATGTGPSTMAIDSAGPFLFTANTGGSGDLSAFLIDKLTGGLTPIAGSPYLAGNNVSSLAFGAGGKFLYAADAGGNTATIQGFSVDLSVAPVGVLKSLSGFPYPLSACNFIVTDQTGAYLYATNGTGIIGYGIDAGTGALSPLPGFPIAVSGAADSIAIDPTNQFLYVRNGAAGTVTGFEVNGATGELTPMPGSPFAVGKAADFLAMF